MRHPPFSAASSNKFYHHIEDLSKSHARRLYPIKPVTQPPTRPFFKKFEFKRVNSI